MFDSMATDTSITEDKDYIKGKGFKPLASGIYDLTIKYAYAAKSKGGAMGINLVFTTPDGTEVKDQQWVTSGDAKGNKNFWIRKVKDKDGNPLPDTKHYLPGFNAINSLCQLSIGKDLSSLGTETKTIKLYDFVAKAEQNTDVEMIMDLVGQKIVAGVLFQVVDKTAKNPTTGKYDPTGQTRETNTIDKYFHPDSRLTTAEKRAEATSPEFANAWEEKWKGQIDDVSTKSANPATAGAPVAAVAAGAAAPKTGIFA